MIIYPLIKAETKYKLQKYFFQLPLKNNIKLNYFLRNVASNWSYNFLKNDYTYVCPEYMMYLHFKIITASHIAINPFKTPPAPFPNTLAPLFLPVWNSSGSLSSRVSLAVESRLLQCPESTQHVYLSWLFWLWERARSHFMPGLVNKVDEGAWTFLQACLSPDSTGRSHSCFWPCLIKPQ